MNVGPAHRLPNFLIIGAMKAGTTSLYNYLRGHPQIFMPEKKEVNFFNPLRNWRFGVEWYEQHFQDAEPDVVAMGEASTSYTKFPWIKDVPERISAVLGNIRLIYVVRDPVERMRSHYLHNVSTGQEWRPIEDAFHRDEMYLNISRYSLQIQQYMPYIQGDESLLVIDSRDLRSRRADTLRRVFDFLGVDKSWMPANIDREYYRSTDRRMKSPVLRTIRHIPRVRTLATYVPGPIKRMNHGLTDRLPTDELDLAKGNLSDVLRASLRDALRADVSELRSFMDDEFDGWGIA
jgi:Sulfotransferase domain